MGHTAKQPIRRDWISKTLAGVLLGLALAFGVSGLLSAWTEPMPLPTRGQLAMWIVPPVWMAVCSGVYFFTTGWRAWAWLGLANLITYGLLLAVRTPAA